MKIDSKLDSNSSSSCKIVSPSIDAQITSLSYAINTFPSRQHLHQVQLYQQHASEVSFEQYAVSFSSQFHHQLPTRYLDPGLESRA